MTTSTFTNNRTLSYPPNFSASEFNVGVNHGLLSPETKATVAWVLQMLRGAVFEHAPIQVLDLLVESRVLKVTIRVHTASKLKHTHAIAVGRGNSPDVISLYLPVDVNTTPLRLTWPANFPQHEFLQQGRIGFDNESHRANQLCVAWILQVLRTYVFDNKPMLVTNAYRNHNEYVRLLRAGYKPSSNSFHNSGLAADITVHQVSARVVQRELRRLNLALAVGHMSNATHLNPSATGYRWFPY